jgi:hypothetical protein
VVVSVPADRSGDWLRDDIVYAVIERRFWRSIDRNFVRMLLSISEPR